MPYNKAPITSASFLDVTMRSLHSDALYSHLIHVQPTNLVQVCDAIMSTWIKNSEECFQHLV